METLIKKVVPSEINDMKVEIEEFIELYNNAEKGFEVKFLSDGLTGLTEYLKGGKAKTIKL
jgi:hypothetical protein